MKVDDLLAGMEQLADSFRLAKTRGTMDGLTEAQVLLLTRGYALLAWSMLKAFEDASARQDRSFGSTTRYAPFQPFTKALWRSMEDASRFRERLAEARRDANYSKTG